ncbi:alpha/beta hydrolase [Streptomyces acidiscabies]|uniref:alpha/beta hydrolase n=1 Tax=Streptomyces acidiscabies TaxID=42234 RepID=UPI00073F71CC|nr:alpha/beta hydrolase [Streptomyces acidiscabies]GAQ58225.1 tripeptidyl aminopeptidase precursor [Streptomyces acidiscabies]GAV44897.1 tripeptidyl aminopeptidase precursor [Streptomyces acidiscabies]
MTFLPRCVVLLAATALLHLPLPSASAAEPLRFGPCPDSVPAPPAPDRVECGHLSVPLDHRRPDGPHIDIAVSRVPASGERRGILLVNPGGPGGSGLPYAVTKRAKLPESVRRAYDVIGFDPRGVGASAPADCGEMGGLFETPAPDLEGRAYLASLKALADDCAGNALPYLSTEETAYDMDAIRSALGEPVTNFLGVSYGSYLGAAYTALFPARTGRMVLDSVVGPWDWYDFDVLQARALLRQRETFFGWAATHDERFGLGDTAEEVRRAYLRVREGFEGYGPGGADGTGASGSGGRAGSGGRVGADPGDAGGAGGSAQLALGPADFDRVVYRALGRTERWAPLADGLRAYLRDGSTDGLRLPAPFDSPASRTYEAANRIVKCADGPAPTPARILADRHHLHRLAPAPVLTGMEAAACAYWHHRPAHRTPLGSPDAPPLLLVASAHDPVTPAEGAHALRRLLPGSRIVTLDDDYSHGVFASRGNACVDGTVAAYLLDGDVPPADVRCVGPGLPAVS